MTFRNIVSTLLVAACILPFTHGEIHCRMCKKAVRFFQMEAGMDLSGAPLSERVQHFCSEHEDIAGRGTCERVNEIISQLNGDEHLAETLQTNSAEDICLAIGYCGETGRRDLSGFARSCFPNKAVATVRQGASIFEKRMDQLRVGDEVMTESGFSPIFAFMDHNASPQRVYLTLRTATGASLTMTDDHYTFAHTPRRPVFAGSVKVGDTLWVSEYSNTTTVPTFSPSVVVEIEQNTEDGLHAPLTKQGTIVVDGVLASSFVKAKTLTWGQTTIVSGHSAVKFIHAPLRWSCEVLPSLCSAEYHLADNGRHMFTQWVLDNFLWLEMFNFRYSDLREACFGNDSDSISVFAAVVQLVVAAALAASYYFFFAFHPSVSATLLVAGFMTIRSARGKAVRATYN